MVKKEKSQAELILEHITVLPENSFVVFGSKNPHYFASDTKLGKLMAMKGITGIVVEPDCTIESLTDDQLATLGLYRKEPTKLKDSDYH